MKSVLLIGLGRFGRHIAIELNRLGHQIMAVDVSEERANEILPYATRVQIGDSTRPEFLKSLGIPSFDLCIVAIGGDFQSSLETTALLREYGAHYVVARAERDLQEKFLLRNGADEVLYPEKQVANWAAIRCSSDRLLDYFGLDDGHAIVEVPLPRAWEGRNVGSIDIRKKHKINIMAVKQNGKMNLSVTPETEFQAGQTLLVLGEYQALRKCFGI